MLESGLNGRVLKNTLKRTRSEMARNKDPQELKRENRDLRRKNAYLEDKVAYLEALYEIIKESPDTISKKTMQGNLVGSELV